jgi:hypothetical protein
MRALSRHVLVLAFVLGLSPVGAVDAHGRGARTIEVRLSSGPHAPGDAPDVVVHVPPGFDAAQPLDFLVFFHGFDGCARALVAREPTPCRSGEAPHEPWNLGGLHSAAATNAILVVPQLAFHARTSRGHRFVQPGRFDAMLTDLLRGELASIIGSKRLSDVRSTALIAHSGGYHATVAVVSDPSRQTRVDRVVMLDALYAGWNVLAEWAKEDPRRRIVSLYTGQKQTVRGNRRLLASLRPVPVAETIREGLMQAVRDEPRLVVQVRTKHADMPRAHLTDVLRGLALANAY